MKLNWTVYLLLPLAASGQAARADSQQPNLIVTANRMPQSTSDILAPYTIISAKQIAQMQAKSITDVLAMQPGVDVRANGGIGQPSSISIRGGTSKQTLILIDGMRAMSASTGSGSLDFLPASMVERIEIIRGPRAAQYGADAMNGVVNIITKPSYAEQVNRLIVGVGQHDYWQSGWRFVHSLGEQTQFQANISAKGSTGYNFKPDSTPAHNYGYSNRQALFTLSHALNSSWSADGEAIINRGHSQYNGYGVAAEAQKTLIQQFYSGTLNYDIDHYSSHWNMNYNVDDSRSMSSSYSRYVTQRYAASWLNSWQLNERWQVDAGLDSRQVNLSKSSVDFNQTKRYNIGGYSSVGYRMGAYQLDASLRQDHNQRYGNNTNYSFAGGWQYLPRQQIKLSYATAFHAPSFNDLFSPLNFGYQGNPNLKPEKSKNIELGLKGTLGRVHYEWNIYRTQYRDLIEITPDFSTSDNISQARITGSEMIVKFALGPIHQQLSYTYMDSQNTRTHKVLTYRPWNNAKWLADWSLTPKLNVHTGIHWNGHRFASSTQRLPSYWTVDVAAGYQLTPSLKLAVSAANLLDRHYQTTYQYMASGLQADLTAQYDF
ncbi:TonB-dependent receptor domain-containing protein [Celerinatantimonas yamalensis]|uniref:TonB-dependent receptor n=1 Tax=Celerinatantimonas yamalensis TaxID=559956 RepID=A0ABW9G8R0_9GAMM